MFSISSSSCCCDLLLVPYFILRTATSFDVKYHTLKARCSKKWAVPLVLSVSALDPASIQTPTVEV